MNIVVLGCDNTGKSTLCNNLKNYLEDGIDFTCDVVHSPGPVSIDEMKEFMESKLISKDCKSHIRIFDRFSILEEFVYGNVLRGVNRFPDEEYNDKLLSQVDLFIYCDPGLDNIIKWDGREQMDGVIENVNRIYGAYKVLVNKLKEKGYNIKTYNYMEDDYRRLV